MAEDDPFPAWSKPASKGDVISALITIRSCIVDIYIALGAIERGDHTKLAESRRVLGENDEKVSDLIDQISGREHGK